MAIKQLELINGGIALNPLSVFSETQHMRAHYSDRRGMAHLQAKLKYHLRKQEESKLSCYYWNRPVLTGDLFRAD
jgi:hypothetical protein